MKKTLALAALAAITIGLAGCNSTAPTGPVNLNALQTAASAIAGPNSGLNLGTFNPALVPEAASYCPQVGTVDVVGFGVNFHWARNAPPGYVYTPIAPPTPDRVALFRADAVAGPIYAMHDNHASDDVTFSATGLVVTIHLAYPPSTLNTTPVSTVTNAVVTLPTTVTIPGATNSVISQLQQVIK